MSIVFLGASSSVVIPDAPVSVDWSGIAEMTFTPQGGDTVDLIRGVSGLILTSDGVRGLKMPPISRNTQTSAGVAGSTWTGFRVLEREVFWPLLVFSDEGSGAFLERDRNLWRGLTPDKVGVWSVVANDGRARTLRVRYASDGDPSEETDASRVGWALYTLTLVAEDPFWMGETVRSQWGTAGAATPMFVPGSGIWIGSSQTIDTATVNNPGDVPTYPIWTVFGPTTSVDVGVGGKVDQLHFPIAAGKAVILDTRPTVRTAFDATAVVVDGVPVATPTGVDLTGSLGSTAFAPIPPGQPIPLSLSMTGTGVVTADVTPRYYRAT